VVEVEVILTTGFTVDVTEEYDTTATGVPRMLSLVWEISGEKEDFIFLNKEDVLTNAAQIATAFEGDVPTSSIIEMGVAASNSHNWSDFHTPAQPAVREFGKIFMLDRTDDPNSLVPIEPLTTSDYLRYKANYGAWNPSASVSLYQVTSSGAEIPVLTGYRLYPRQGEVHFDTRQDPSKQFKVQIINPGELRVGIRLRNRLHSEAITVQGAGYIYTTNDVKPVELSQVAPRALNAMISPESPTSRDTIYALYDYVDLNNDVEQDTIISWFRNGQQLLEIQNKTYWTDSDLLPANKLQPNDQLSFSVTPSDGRDYGATVFSPSVVVAAIPPGVQDLRIVPYRNDVINDRHDTSSTYVVEYEFVTDETGSAALESGTVIQWFVNGSLFKEGVYSEFEQDDQFDPTRIEPGELYQGITSHVIGNQIYVEVTPKTINIQGDLTRSDTVTVQNSLPIATDVTVQPLEPTVQSTLLLTYNVDDYDISSGTSTQSDQSDIQWYFSPNGVTFTEVTDLRGQSSVTPDRINAGEHWKAIVTPDDGLDLGAPVESNIVVIQA
jgi:hypothetical protein